MALKYAMWAMPTLRNISAIPPYTPPSLKGIQHKQESLQFSPATDDHFEII